MAAQRKSIKVARNDLVKSLTVEVAKSTVITPEVDAKIRAKALEKHPRQVSEAPDGAYNHSNSTLLRSLASLVVMGADLTEGPLAETWNQALLNNHVTVVGDTDDTTGVREGDIYVGQYIVRAAEGGGCHVFRKGAEREGNTVADMASDLLDS